MLICSTSLRARILNHMPYDNPVKQTTRQQFARKILTIPYTDNDNFATNHPIQKVSYKSTTPFDIHTWYYIIIIFLICLTSPHQLCNRCKKYLTKSHVRIFDLIEILDALILELPIARTKHQFNYFSLSYLPEISNYYVIIFADTF